RAPRPLRPGSVCAAQVTGHHRMVGPGEDQSDAELKPAQLTSDGAGAFRKNKQDIPCLLQHMSAQAQALLRINMTIKRQGVGHYGGQGKPWHALKEVVLGCRREGAMQFVEWQRRQETEGIQMAGVVSDEHIR